jgi:hypothetical protein
MHASIESSIDSSITLRFELVCDRISFVLEKDGVSQYHVNVHKPIALSTKRRQAQHEHAAYQLRWILRMVRKHDASHIILSKLLFREMCGVMTEWMSEEDL